MIDRESDPIVQDMLKLHVDSENQLLKNEIDRLKLRLQKETAEDMTRNQPSSMSSVSSFASPSDEGGEVCPCSPDRVLSCSCTRLWSCLSCLSFPLSLFLSLSLPLPLSLPLSNGRHRPKNGRHWPKSGRHWPKNVIEWYTLFLSMLLYMSFSICFLLLVFSLSVVLVLVPVLVLIRVLVLARDIVAGRGRTTTDHD